MNTTKRNIIVLILISCSFLLSCGESTSPDVDATKLFGKYRDRLTNLAVTIESTSSAADVRQRALTDVTQLTDSCMKVLKRTNASKENQAFHQSAMDVFEAVQSELLPLFKNLTAIEQPEANVDAYNDAAEKFNAAYARVETMINKAFAAQETATESVN